MAQLDAREQAEVDAYTELERAVRPARGPANDETGKAPAARALVYSTDRRRTGRPERDAVLDGPMVRAARRPGAQQRQAPDGNRAYQGTPRASSCPRCRARAGPVTRPYGCPRAGPGQPRRAGSPGTPMQSPAVAPSAAERLMTSWMPDDLMDASTDGDAMNISWTPEYPMDASATPEMPCVTQPAENAMSAAKVKHIQVKHPTPAGPLAAVCSPPRGCVCVHGAPG
jgi:hypothetical protein